MKTPIRTTQPFKGIPEHTIFTDYLISVDLFDDTIVNYTVYFKGRDVMLPGKSVSLISEDDLKLIPTKEKTSDTLKTALDLLKSAENVLYEAWLTGEENEYKTFLNEHGIILENRKRLCKDCGKREPVCAPYCDHCTWSHEPGY